MKGKKQGVPVYELLALAADNDADAVAIADGIDARARRVSRREFDQAAAAWDEVLRSARATRPHRS